jgi:lipoate-protein ligase A
MIWTAEPGVYIGKNQNTLEELNIEFVKENNFDVFRRLSGGGTIFHDEKTVYYTFITKNERTVKENFIYWNNVIVDFLNSVNIKANLSGRNDVLIDGRKISGSAEHYKGDILVHHGSLLFDTDIPFLAQALTPNKKKFISKAVNSVKARVDNIQNHTDLNVDEFKSALVQYVENRFNGVKVPATKEENEITLSMRKDKYTTDEWNYGMSPKYTHFKEDKYPYGIVGVQLNVENGLISDISITGDFFSTKDKADLEQILIGWRHERTAIEEILGTIKIDEYISGAVQEDLLKLMW